MAEPNMNSEDVLLEIPKNLIIDDEEEHERLSKKMIVGRSKIIEIQSVVAKEQIRLAREKQFQIELAKEKYTTAYISAMISSCTNDEQKRDLEKYKMEVTQGTIKWDIDLVEKLMNYDNLLKQIEGKNFKKNIFGKIYDTLSGGDQDD